MLLFLKIEIKKNKSYNLFVKKKLYRIEEFLKERIGILDGAMGTEISKLNLKLKCNEELNFKNPDYVKNIHLNYLKAGADIIETNTFNANKISLFEFGIRKNCYELNKMAVEIAKEAIEEFNSKENKFIAGSIGPTNKFLSFSKDISFDQMEEAFFEQAFGLIEGGVDLLLIETITDSLNAKSCVFGIKKAMKESKKDVPFVLSLSLSKDGRTLNGQSIESFVLTTLPFEPFGFGLNCSFGPENFEGFLLSLKEITEKPIFLYPNAGIPDEKGNYKYSVNEFAKILKKYAKKGLVNVIGGCCGTNPQFIRKLKESIKELKPKFKKIKEKIYLSALDSFEITSEKIPIFAGERCNIKGSREFREAVFKGDFEKCVEIAKEQIEKGSELIDIFLEDPERKEEKDFEKFLSLLFPSFKKTIMIDSQNVKAIETALKKIPGKAIINSVNLDDKKRFEKISKIALKWGSYLVFQTIEKKINCSAKENIEIAKRGYEILVDKIKFPFKYIIFDPVILPVGFFDFKLNHIFETLKTIKYLKKEFPQNLTILGISNVSYGLPKNGREILNSVFLYYATKYGLDIAILNPKKIKRFFSIKKKEKLLAENLIFKRNEKNLKAFIEYFKIKKDEKEKVEVIKRPEDIVKNCILKGEKKNLYENLDKLIEKKMDPLRIIDEILIPSMQILGEKFAKNEVILPEVLESASIMSSSLEYLKPYLKKNIPYKAKILLATVIGDVHDIGKNLFATIAKNNGYEVIDLGVKVPKEKIIEKAVELNVDVIGLSGLLSRSCLEMVEVVKELSKIENLPILILGGAALTKSFVQNKIKPISKFKVFYASSAMEGIKLLNKFFSKND